MVIRSHEQERGVGQDLLELGIRELHEIRLDAHYLGLGVDGLAVPIQGDHFRCASYSIDIGVTLGRDVPRFDDVWIEEGEFLIVPRGVEHRPVADEETHILLFEPANTLNTGNVEGELTAKVLDWI